MTRKRWIEARTEGKGWASVVEIKIRKPKLLCKRIGPFRGTTKPTILGHIFCTKQTAKYKTMLLSHHREHDKDVILKFN